MSDSITTRADALMAELEARGSESGREGMARYAINTDDAFGVSVYVLRAMAKPVAVVPPDPLWRTQFVREARVVAQALGDLEHTLHHIGSTAIEGIHAKPVIDMLLLVPDLGALDARTAAGAVRFLRGGRP